MEGLAVMGFVFGMVGVVAFVRLDKTNKDLKRKRNSRRGLQGSSNSLFSQSLSLWSRFYRVVYRTINLNFFFSLIHKLNPQSLWTHYLSMGIKFLLKD